MEALILIAIFVAGAVFVANRMQAPTQQAIAQNDATAIEDARAEAGRWVDRLGGQVLHLEGLDVPSKQALADANERYNSAVTQLTEAKSPAQARFAQDSALEGLYYVRAAREHMGMDPGPELPKTSDQDKAGRVTEERTIEHEGETLTAAPGPSDQTPHYYPGGSVAGRPVPAGWYSEPWWATALHTGMWALTYTMMFNMMFAGMSGVGYGGDQFAAGMGDGGAMGDVGGDGGGFFDGGLFGGDDGGAADAGAGDGGGFFDGGLFGGGGDGGGGGLFGGGDGGGFFDGGLFDF